MRKPPAEQVMMKCGALLDGHFILRSGRHSGRYVEKAEICADPFATDNFCWWLASDAASQFSGYKGNMIEIVVGIAPIGVVLANRVAYHLSEFYNKKVVSVFLEKDQDGKLVFRRGYAAKVSEKRVLLVDDTLTTGASARSAKEAVGGAGGRVLGLSLICKRGELRAEINISISALVELNIEDYSPPECPFCRENIPLEDPKSR